MNVERTECKLHIRRSRVLRQLRHGVSQVQGKLNMRRALTTHGLGARNESPVVGLACDALAGRQARLERNMRAAQGHILGDGAEGGSVAALTCSDPAAVEQRSASMLASAKPTMRCSRPGRIALALAQASAQTPAAGTNVQHAT
jgi:hypothetical protein